DKGVGKLEVRGKRIGGKLEARLRDMSDAIRRMINKASCFQALAAADLGDGSGRAGLQKEMDQEIGPLAGRKADETVVERARLDRLAVEGDELDAGMLDAQLEHERVAAVTEAQAQVGIVADDNFEKVLAVQRKGVAEATGVTPVHHVAQRGFMDLAVLPEPPVVGDDGEVADARRRLRLLDDEKAIEAACHLLPAAVVWVVPEGAGIGHGKAVVEGLARLHGMLR